MQACPKYHITEQLLSLAERSRLDDLMLHIGILLREVLLEHHGKLLCLFVICSLISPCVAGIHDLGGHSLDGLRDVNVEYVVMLELGILDRTVQGSGDHSPGIGKLHAASDTIRAAGPSGVDKIDLCVILRDLLAEHLGISLSRERHEGLAEEGGERGLRLLDAALCACTLGSQARDKVIHGRILVKP